jgi:uncharacterized protein (TIGR00369 family)
MKNNFLKQMLEGTLPLSPAEKLLGWQCVEIDEHAGTIYLAYNASEQFLNPGGTINGGILSAMLDSAMGCAVSLTLEADEFAPTLEIKTSFHKGVKPGTVFVNAKLVKRTRQIAWMSAEMSDEQDQLVASATATAVIKTWG